MTFDSSSTVEYIYIMIQLRQLYTMNANLVCDRQLLRLWNVYTSQVNFTPVSSGTGTPTRNSKWFRCNSCGSREAKQSVHLATFCDCLQGRKQIPGDGAQPQILIVSMVEMKELTCKQSIPVYHMIHFNPGNQQQRTHFGNVYQVVSFQG